LRRIFSIAIASVFLLTAFCAGHGTVFTAYATATSASQSDIVVSSADAAYFDRIAVIPIDVEVPEFYQKVLNVAGMYIFSMPDGTIHKRIYGALNGVYGWYIPVGTENIVPLNSSPIDIHEDIAIYEEAMILYEAEQGGNQPYYGILPPETGSFDLPEVFGIASADIFKYSLITAAVLCLLILAGYAVRINKRKRQN